MLGSDERKHLSHWLVYGVIFGLLPFIWHGFTLFLTWLNSTVSTQPGPSTAPHHLVQFIHALSPLWPHGELLAVGTAVAGDILGTMVARKQQGVMIGLIGALIASSCYYFAQFEQGTSTPDEVCMGSLVIFVGIIITGFCVRVLPKPRSQPATNEISLK